MVIYNISERLEFEYEKFFSFCKLISRTDFYTRAFEIASKTAIYNALKKDIADNALSEDFIIFLMNQENMIDYIYMKAEKDMVLTNGELTEKVWSRLKIKIKF